MGAHPPTELTEWLRQVLEAANLGIEPIDACLEIERKRYHMLALPWGRGTDTRSRVDWTQRWRWGFVWGDYLAHVATCDNRFHVDPIMYQAPDSPTVELRWVAVLEPRTGKRRKPVKAQPPRGQWVEVGSGLMMRRKSPK